MNIQRKSLSVAAFLLCMSLGVAAQSVKLHLNGVSVKTAMTQLREKSGYSFVFAANDINTSRKVNVNATELKQAVNQILVGQGVSYKIEGKNIVVSKSAKAEKGGATQQKGDNRKKVTGNVVDETGMPVIGATIRQKGTQNAVVTDFDGNFTLNVPEGAELEINYIGYEQKALRIGDKDSYSLALTPASKELNEVVVTALGIKRAEKALQRSAGWWRPALCQQRCQLHKLAQRQGGRCQHQRFFSRCRWRFKGCDAWCTKHRAVEQRALRYRRCAYVQPWR